MEAISRALADIHAIIDDGGSVESMKMRVGRVVDVMERALVLEMSRPPREMCRVCAAPVVEVTVPAPV